MSTSSPVTPTLAAELTRWRRDFHRHPHVMNSTAAVSRQPAAPSPAPRLRPAASGGDRLRGDLGVVEEDLVGAYQSLSRFSAGARPGQTCSESIRSAAAAIGGAVGARARLPLGFGEVVTAGQGRLLIKKEAQKRK